MEKRTKCQICNRYFSNRKALGGHMKSHFVKAPIAAGTSTPPPPSPNGFQQPRDLYSHMHNCQDSVFIDKSDDVFSDDTTRSSNCTASQPAEAQSCVISGSSISPEVDAAQCLLMLSKAIWNKDPTAVGIPLHNYESDHVDDDQEQQVGEEEEEDGDGEETLAYDSSADEQESCIVKPQSQYKCDTCNKEFKSYQALGGHRSSHSNSNNLANNHRIFKCSYCPRVFDSGQALGGHKKVHSKNSMDDPKSIMIDLNIPVQDREFNDKYESFIRYDSLLH